MNSLDRKIERATKQAEAEAKRPITELDPKAFELDDHQPDGTVRVTTTKPWPGGGRCVSMELDGRYGPPPVLKDGWYHLPGIGPGKQAEGVVGMTNIHGDRLTSNSVAYIPQDASMTDLCALVVEYQLTGAEPPSQIAEKMLALMLASGDPSKAATLVEDIISRLMQQDPSFARGWLDDIADAIVDEMGLPYLSVGACSGAMKAAQVAVLRTFGVCVDLNPPEDPKRGGMTLKEWNEVWNERYQATRAETEASAKKQIAPQRGVHDTAQESWAKFNAAADKLLKTSELLNAQPARF